MKIYNDLAKKNKEKFYFFWQNGDSNQDCIYAVGYNFTKKFDIDKNNNDIKIQIQMEKAIQEG